MAVLTRRRSCTLAAAFAIAAALVVRLPPPVAAQEPGEDAIKAAFLYNFTRFIDWPDAAFAGSPTFNVCVYAQDQFRQQLRVILAGEKVRGREIRIEELGNGDSLKGCHLVYYGPQDLERSARQLPSLRQVPVLTVGEGQRFLEQGGLIAFQLEDNRVRFDISRAGAEAAGLAVSSKLLRVARQVVGAPAP